MKIIKKIAKKSKRIAEKILYSFMIMMMVLQPVSAPGILRAVASDDATAEAVSAPASDSTSADKEEPKEEVKEEPKEETVEESTPAPKEELEEEVSASTEESTPTEEENAEVIEDSSEGQITEEAASIVAPEAGISQENSSKEETKEDIWSKDGDKYTTNHSVEKGVKYVAPQNDDVTVTFTKLPENPGKLSIEEIKLTDEQVSSLNALSNKAYDITSDMEDGTFEYDLTLPKPEGQDNVQIKYAEKESELDDAKTVEDIEVRDSKVKANKLDHFTIWIVSADMTVTGSFNNSTQITVGPSQMIDVKVEVGLDHNSTWKSIRWKIDGGWHCENTIEDHVDNVFGEEFFTENFDIPAPSTSGQYDLRLRAYSQNNCLDDYASFTLTDGINVISVPESTPGSITIIKEANPESSQSFDFNSNVLGDFDLVDDGTSANTKTFSNLTPGNNYNITEDNAGLNGKWDLTDISCSEGGDNIKPDIQSRKVSIDLQSGENVVCTFTNTKKDYCGDGYVDKGEQCDDGNNSDQDGCSSDCRIEYPITFEKQVNGGISQPSDWSFDVSGYGTISNGDIKYFLPGYYTVSENGPAHYALSATSGSCHDNGNGGIELAVSNTDPDFCQITNSYQPYCGDGNIDQGEQCDDANSVDSDSCNNLCQINSDTDGDGIIDLLDNCPSTANPDQADSDGDGIGDACDNCVMVANANQADDDSDGIGNVCDAQNCGNGITEGDEQCDDANSVDDDSCSNTCELVANCGDGIKSRSEQCDGTDGVAEDGLDFCNSQCELVPVYSGAHECPEGTIEEYASSISLNSRSSVAQSLSLTSGNAYLLKASGTYQYGGGASRKADPAYGTTDNFSTWRTDIGIWGANRGVTSILGDLGQGMGVIEWDDNQSINLDHTYSSLVVPTDNIDAQFVISDWYGDWYDNDDCSGQKCMSDNSGSLNIDLYQCVSPAPVCGNETIEDGETCDDGNTNNGDGCSATCQIEYGTIHGYKWNDVDGNGVLNNEEPLLSGWTINLYKSNGEGYDSEPTETMDTDSNEQHFGWYWFENLVPGEYKVCEVQKEGWRQTFPNESSCYTVNLPDDNSYGFHESENYVSGPEYNFGNQQVGKIIVNKITNPANSQQSFEFSGSWSQETFNVSSGNPVDSGYIVSGTYSLSEVNIPTGWDLTGATCDDGSDPESIDLSAGETVTCNFTNTERGTITITKHANKSTNKNFRFTTNYSPAIVLANGESSSSDYLVAGTYTVKESDNHTWWDLDNIFCSDSTQNSTYSTVGRTTTINLVPGANMVCVYNNKYHSHAEHATGGGSNTTSGGTNPASLAGTPGGATVAGETTEGSNPTEENGGGQVEGVQNESGVKGVENGCKEWPLWVWILLMLAYLGVFSFSTFNKYKEGKNLPWVSQVIELALILFIWYFYEVCRLYKWFPWTAIILGAIVYVIFYFAKKKATKQTEIK